MGKTEWTMTAIFTAIGALFTIIAISVESVVAKWIWGILAAAVFIFTIYAIIDAIVKSRRKPKNLADLLLNYMEQESKKPGFKEDLVKRMESNANRRDVLYDSQRPDNEDFGYSLSNPVMTSTISSSDKYLQNLRTLDGKPFTWERQGSYCVANIGGIENVMVDKYQLYLDGEEYVELYLCPYGHNSSFVPKGIALSGESDLEKEAKEKGITVDQLIEIRKMQEENAKLKQRMEQKERKEFEELAAKVRQTYPAFEFQTEFNNPLFAELVRAKIDMQTVYELLHKDELLTKKDIDIVVDQNSDYYTSDYFYYTLCNNDSFLRGVSSREIETEEELQKRADESGISLEHLKAIKKMERENEDLKIKDRKENYLKQSKLAVKVKYEYPQFDLEAELLNARFTQLINMGIDMQLVYESIHINELFDRIVG